MDIYLVRKGPNQVAHVTFSKRRAIARAAKMARDAQKVGDDRRPGSYFLQRKVTGAEGKIWAQTLFRECDGAAHPNWVTLFWVQKHQLLDTPLEMLAAEGEETDIDEHR